MKETKKCIVLIASGAIFGWGATTIWPFAPFEPTKKDWVDVLAAVGTCAAVFVALWFGVRERVLAHREARARATLVAAKITPRLARFIDQLLKLMTRLRRYDGDRFPRPLEYESVRSAVEVMHWDIATDDLIALTPLPRHAAVRLSKGVGISNVIASAIIDAQGWMQSDGEWGKRATVMDSWASQLDDAHALVSDAFSVCNEEAQRATFIDAATRGFFEDEEKTPHISRR